MSHYSKEFINMAHSPPIVVICYPPHTTHVLQGLDIVIFAVVKGSWSAALDEWEQETGQKVTKDDFLFIYAKAHLKGFTKSNILQAFQKTGVYPLNPNKITTTQMAPALEHSITGTLVLSGNPCQAAYWYILSDLG